MKQRLPVTLNLSLVSSFVILGFSIIAPVLPQYALSFSISVALAGWAISAFAVARIVMDLPGGLLADRFGRKRNMIAGLVLVILSGIASGVATSYSLLIVGRVIQGIGSALYVTSATAWVAEVSSGPFRGRLMSVYSGFIFAATAFGPAIGGYTAAHFGLSAPFFAYSAFSVLGLLATIPLKESRQSLKGAPSVRLSDVPDVLRSRSFLLVNLSVLALFFLRAGVRSTLVPLYAAYNLGLSESRIGLILTVAAVVTSIFTFPSGWFSDRVGRRAPIMSCLFLSAFAVILIPFQGSLTGLVAIMAIYGLATGLQGSIAAWPADVAPEGRLGTSMGIYRVIGDVGLFLGPITVTYVAGYSGGTTLTFVPFVVPAVISFVTGLLMILPADPIRERKE